MRLDAAECGECRSMNERAWGGLSYQGKVVGEEPDAAALGACRRRRSGAPAVERKAQTDAPGGGEYVCMVNVTRGGAESPESAPDLVGTEGGVERKAWGRANAG